MISDPFLLKAMIISLKITLIFQTALIFFFFGKNNKIPSNARHIFFILANSGCFFLAGGLIFENLLLVKGGIFILITHACLDAHYLISKYQKIKLIKKEKENSDAKK